MGTFKILFMNLGYARGISGRLAEHLRYGYRHLYCSPLIQKESLKALGRLIVQEDPDVCCLVEIDRGSPFSARLNQLEMLINDTYAFSDIENKYGPDSRWRSFSFTAGRCNAFLAKRPCPFEKLYFQSGIKRLVYKMAPETGLTLFFAHFSLNEKDRARQIQEVRALMDGAPGEVIFLGDFNVLSGIKETAPITADGRYVLLNRETDPTFVFHRRKRVLDLCFCSQGIARDAALKVIPQPYSDHAALMLEVGAVSLG